MPSGTYGYTGPGIPDINRVTNPRQPDTNNILNSNYFKFEFTRLPTMTYFCQRVNMPSVSLSVVDQRTRFGLRNKYVGGDYTFEELSVEFIVDEKMLNYKEIYEWMRSIGNMENYDDVIDKEQTPDFFSDARLIITNSSFKEQIHVVMKETFPIALSGLNFDSTLGESQPLIAVATFALRNYNIVTL